MGRQGSVDWVDDQLDLIQSGNVIGLEDQKVLQAFFFMDVWSFLVKIWKLDLEEQPHREITDELQAMADQYFEIRLRYLFENGDVTKRRRKKVEDTDLPDDARRNSLLFNVPRDCFKSSLGAGFCAYMLLRAIITQNDPFFRIIIDSATKALSLDLLSVIKEHFEYNPLIAGIFGEMYVKKGFKEEYIRVKPRYEAIERGDVRPIKEPNIRASGIGAEKTGQHSDFTWYDDLATKKNSGTELQRGKVIDHYSAMQPIVDPPGMELATFTRYHDGDLGGHWFKLQNDAIKNGLPLPFRIIVRSCYLRDPENSRKWELDQETGEPILYFPGRITHRYLAERRLTMTAYDFSCQYYNDPTAEENQKIKDSWVDDIWMPVQDFPDDLYHLGDGFMVADPSHFKAQYTQPDDFCILSFWICKNLMLWITAVFLDRMTAKKTVDKFINMYNLQRMIGGQKFRHARVEGHDGHLAFQTELELEKERSSINDLKIVWAPHTRREGSKDERINTIVPYFEFRRIKVASGLDIEIKAKIIDSLTRWPFAIHDDFPDTVAMAVELATAIAKTRNQQDDLDAAIASERMPASGSRGIPVTLDDLERHLGCGDYSDDDYDGVAV